MMPSIDIQISGETMRLCAERAMFWLRAKTLIVADTHFGKAATFRAAGIPVPEAGTEADLDRLAGLIRQLGAGRLLVLGDFFHAKQGRTQHTLQSLGRFFNQHRSMQTLLVLGNHDEHAGTPPKEWGVKVVEEPWPLSPFVLRHIPEPSPDGHVLAGHWHPGGSLASLLPSRSGGTGRAGRGGRANRVGIGETVPCFHMGESVTVLPAFGSFTGFKRVPTGPGDRVVLVTPQGVAALPV